MIKNKENIHLNLGNTFLENEQNKIKAALFFFVFVMHVIVALQLNNIYVIGDEFCVLANTAYFAGDNFSPLVHLTGYYGYGQSLLYLPLYIIFKNKAVFYKATLIVNGVLISIIPIICYKILTEILEVKDKKFNILSSLVIGCLPAALFLAKWSWNEPILFILVWSILYYILKEVKNESNKKQKIKSSIIVSFLLCYGYASNGRFMGVLCSVFIIILIGYVIKKKIFNIIPFVACMGVFLSIDNVIKQDLLKNLWLVTDTVQNTVNTVDGTLSMVLPYLFSVEGINRLITIVIGNIWYIVVSTFGLIVIGFVCVLQKIYRYIRYYRKDSICENKIILIFGIFSVLLVLAGVGVGALSFLPEKHTNNATFYIYGRYIESLMGPLILFGLYYYKEKCHNKKIFIIGMVIYIFINILFWMFTREKLLSCTTQINDINVLSIYSFKYYLNFNYELSSIFSATHLNSVIIWTTLLTIIINGLAFLSKQNLKLIVILIVYLSSYLFVSSTFIYNKSNSNQIDMVTNIFEQIQGLEINSNQIYASSLGLAMKTQFKLPEYKVLFRDGIDNLKKGSFYITTEHEVFDLTEEEFYLLEIDTQEPLYIWIYGEELKEELLQKGYQVREKVVFNSKNGLSKTGERDNSETKLELKSNEIQYGPYITLETGKYKVVIEGNNLENAYCDVVYRKDDIGEEKNIELLDGAKSNKSIEYSIILHEEVDNVEFRVFNFGENNVVVDSILIEKNSIK